MGGKGGSKKKSTPAPPPPPPPQPINYGAVMSSASQAAKESFRDQMAATVEYYPQMEKLQLGTAEKLRDQLNNTYTTSALQEINDAIAQQGAIDFEADRISNQGGLIGEFALQNYLTSGPTRAEQRIQRLGQQAMRQRADQIVAPTNVREVSAANLAGVRDVNAINARGVGEIAAGQVGAGLLGQALINDAVARVANRGRLSSEASRDAIQAARAGMAARGMATGNAGLAAELLNRDRFARAREIEDMQLAGNIQQQDVARQFQNVGAALDAARANQAMAGQLSLADQAAAMDAQRLNQARDITVGTTNAQLAQQAALANQSRDQALAEMSLQAQQANQAANMSQLAANRGFMLDANNAFNQGTMARRDQAAQQAALGANLMQSAAGLYGNAANIGFAGAGNLLSADPYARAMGLGLQSGGNNQANLMQGAGNAYGNALNAGLGVASFNTNMQASMYNSYLNNQAAMSAARMQSNAMNQQGMMGMLGGIGGGAVMGVGLAL